MSYGIDMTLEAKINRATLELKEALEGEIRANEKLFKELRGPELDSEKIERFEREVMEATCFQEDIQVRLGQLYDLYLHR